MNTPDDTLPGIRNAGAAASREPVVVGGRLQADGGPAGGVPAGPETVLIGRAPGCALVLRDGSVSRVHAEMQATGRGVRLRDRGSRNGTFVGQAGSELRVEEVYLTRPCVGRFGRCTWRFAPDAPEALQREGAARFGSLVGTSPVMVALFATLRRIADQSVSVLIAGEPGTDTEAVARSIHQASPGARGSFTTIHCIALDAADLEAKLFGVAARDDPGILVGAQGGTVLVHEIGQMDKALQAKLWKALCTGQVRPVGSRRARRFEARTMFTTSTDLRLAVEFGSFRQDLYAQIAQALVVMPPLHERQEDMPLVVRHLLEVLRRPDVRVDKAALRLLRAHPWPANDRELQSVLHMALRGLVQGAVLTADVLRPLLQATAGAALAPERYELAKNEVDWQYWGDLFLRYDGNISRIARASGRHRTTVRLLLRRLGLRGPEDVQLGRPRAEPEKGEG